MQYINYFLKLYDDNKLPYISLEWQVSYDDLQKGQKIDVIPIHKSQKTVRLEPLLQNYRVFFLIALQNSS